MILVGFSFYYIVYIFDNSQIFVVRVSEIETGSLADAYQLCLASNERHDLSESVALVRTQSASRSEGVVYVAVPADCGEGRVRNTL